MAVAGPTSVALLGNGHDLTRGGTWEGTPPTLRPQAWVTASSAPAFSTSDATEDTTPCDAEGRWRRMSPTGKTGDTTLTFGGIVTSDAHGPAEFLNTVPTGIGTNGVAMSYMYHGRGRGEPCILMPAVRVTGRPVETPPEGLVRFSSEMLLDGAFYDGAVLMDDWNDSISVANGDATAGTRQIDLGASHLYLVSSASVETGGIVFHVSEATPFAAGSTLFAVGATNEGTALTVSAVAQGGRRITTNRPGSGWNASDVAGVTALRLNTHPNGVLVVAHLVGVVWASATQIQLRVVQSATQSGANSAVNPGVVLTATPTSAPNGHVAAAAMVGGTGGVSRYLRASWTIAGFTGDFRAAVHMAAAAV